MSGSTGESRPPHDEQPIKTRIETNLQILGIVGFSLLLRRPRRREAVLIEYLEASLVILFSMARRISSCSTIDASQSSAAALVSTIDFDRQH